MKLETLSPELQEAIKKTAKEYDFYVSYIDDGFQHAQAVKNNKDIIEKLAYFGFDINLNEIEAKKFPKLYRGRFSYVEDESTAVAQKLEVIESCSRQLEQDPRKTYLLAAIENSKTYEVKTQTVEIGKDGFLEKKESIETRKTLDFKLK
jgi:hypothetical protein